MCIALRVSDLYKKYNHSDVALSGFNLLVKENSFLALLGKNGAGKTTFIGIISSLVRKTSGKIFVYNNDVDTHFDYIKSFIGVVPQEINLPVFEKTIQVLINQAGYYGISTKIATERARKYLIMTDLWSKHDVQVRMLSGGMKRRLMLARALMHEPLLLLLDEPTVGIDIEVRYKIWDFLIKLRKSGKTIILTTHYLEEAEKLCDSLAIIDKGKILMHEQMSTILKKTKGQNLILDVDIHNAELSVFFKKYKNIKFDDKHQLEVELNCGDKGLNEILKEIMNAGVIIKNIRNKNNSLESFFNKIIAS